MYTVSPTTVTPYTCHYLLSLLDDAGYDTWWIRNVWNSQGISDGWCANRCIEIINRENIDIPDDLYGIRWKDNALDRVSSYYNTSYTIEPTNTCPRYSQKGVQP